MRTPEQKTFECETLQLVYSPDEFASVSASENPDFILRRRSAALPFGVEITEYYASESTARIRKVPGYVKTLLSGGRPLHKDDHDLKPVEVEIFSPQGVSKGTTKALIGSQLPPLSAHVGDVLARIIAKDRKLRLYRRDLSHVNLVIHDTESRFSHVPPEEFYPLFFTPDVTAALASTLYREIFYITSVKADEPRQVYVPLRMVLLVSECFLFNAAWYGFSGDSTSTPQEQMALFAAFMLDRGVPVEAVADTDFGIEVRLGNTGLVATDEWELRIHDFADHVLPADRHVSLPADQITREFKKAYRSYRSEHTFSSGLVFDTCTSR